jgi:hypothetical protein
MYAVAYQWGLGNQGHLLRKIPEAAGKISEEVHL